MNDLSLLNPDRELAIGSTIIITGNIWKPEVPEAVGVENLRVQVRGIVHTNHDRSYMDSPVHHVVLAMEDGTEVYAYPSILFEHSDAA